MKIKFASTILLTCLCLTLFSGCAGLFNRGDASKKLGKKLNFFEWQNPAPRFADLGLTPAEACSIVGENQLLIKHSGTPVDLWTCTGRTGKGKVKHYDEAQFVTNLAVFDKPREAVIAAYMNFQDYPNFMPQVTDIGIAGKEANQFFLRMKQSYKLIYFSLSADFIYLYSVEENGDLSALLISGDVGAGVARVEFIPVDENKTLVASTTWIDLASAKFVYRTIIKAQPDITATAPIAASAMLTNQFRSMVEGKKSQFEDMAYLPREPVTPVFTTGNIPVETLKKLSGLGTVTFVYRKQWIQTDSGPKCMEFVSSVARIPGEIHQCQPISSDFTRFNEYFDQAKSVEIDQGEDGYANIDWAFRLGLSYVGVDIRYGTRSYWINPNTTVFEGTGGDIDPLYGAWEWIDLENGTTLLIFTNAANISDTASWVVKLGNKIPDSNIIAGIFMGTLIVEKQEKWIEKELLKYGSGSDVAVQ